MIKTCPQCGEEFQTSLSYKIYCSILCQRKAQNAKRLKQSKEYIKHCISCGKEFKTNIRSQKYCSKRCSQDWQNKIYRETHRGRERNRNREYTTDSVFLINKWYREGDSIEKICEILDRSYENVKNAIEMGKGKSLDELM